MALDAETLLQHGAWLARFARALVASESEIDDVVQQTFAQALERPPRHARNLRGWLGAIARNVVRTRARSDSARVAREVALPPPPPVETPDQAVERAELRRMVVEAVLALNEPYRSTVILRFFEEQEVAEVARLTRTGEDTVRTRLRRGVARVRELLERKVTGEARGAADEGVAAQALLYVHLREIAASAPLSAGAGGGGATGSAAASRRLVHAGGRRVTSAVTRRILVAAATVVVAAGGWWWWKSPDRVPPRPEVPVTAREPAAPAVASEAAPASAAPVAVERTAEPVAPTSRRTRAASVAAIRGTVTDPDGKPVSGARVWAILSPAHEADFAMPEFAIPAARFAERDTSVRREGNWIPTSSDANGRYEFSGLSTLPGWAIGAYEPSVGAMVSDAVDFDHDHLEARIDVKLMRGTVLRGSVRDEDGAPVGAARVFLFTTIGKQTTRLSFHTQPSGAAVGTFDMGFRCGDSFEIGCGTPTFFNTKRGKVTIAPDTKETPFKITLKRRPGILVRGRIVDAAGAPYRLEALLDERYPSSPPTSRLFRAAIWAIAPDAKLPTPLLAGVATGEGVIEGRIDFVASAYEVVVPEGFRGSLELRVFKTVVGSAPLNDLARPPDLQCDGDLLPKPPALVTFTVRYVDSVTKLPIDLDREELLPGGSDAQPEGPVLDSILDAKQGVVRYRSVPGTVKLQALLRGHALSLFAVPVAEKEAAEPVTLEVAPSNAGVHGFAFHADGRPFAKAGLSLFRASPAGFVDYTVGPTAANTEGEFEFEPLAKDEHVLVVSGQPDEAPGVARFVAAEPFPDVEVRTTAGHATRFHVAAEPIPNATPATEFAIVDASGLVLEDLGAKWSRLASSPDDVTATLADGHYAVRASRLGYRVARVEFDVPAKETVEVPLEPADLK